MEEDSPEGWYYLGTDGAENGPLNFRIIRAHLRLGTLPVDIPVWREGLRDWTEAKNISLFRNMGGGVAGMQAPSSPLVEETVRGVANGIYDAKTNYVTEGGTPLFPSTPERRFLLHQDRHDGKKYPSTSTSNLAKGSAGKRQARGGANSWATIRGGEWFYCSRETKEPRGPVSTAKLIELAKKGILTHASWVWSEEEQPFWVKFSECTKFKDLGVVTATGGGPREKGASQAMPRGAAARSYRSHGRDSDAENEPPASQPLQQQQARKRHARHKKRGSGTLKHKQASGSSAKRGGRGRSSHRASPDGGGGSGSLGMDNGIFEDLAAFERENELERANSELQKALFNAGTKESKLREYKSKIKLLKEELRIRDEQISSISVEKSQGHQGENGEESSLLRAQLDMAELKLREQDRVLEQKNEDIKRLEITVAETDSELTKARIALSKELSWLLEENAQ
ncbi:hypothetical protein HOP50_09g57380 [Chloropicon primus]|uniref:GYF domain-containing protein n=1 Tax=Chloropicon primus TaxID=1764295 RepID=A0A5B8MRI3_9CHLO|nr:hypothetical protein A3770_09p57170 [Chloropicon primus]UPR02412.1 hypothetical protein HOP50_09g57380 [Chloropicon primus]|eukprot:QDZ23199.1 hypothetical protein A3770_09p57170 [Chloropicon primus]